MRNNNNNNNNNNNMLNAYMNIKEKSPFCSCPTLTHPHTRHHAYF